MLIQVLKEPLIYVYLIRCIGDTTSYLKIGLTKDLNSRLSSLQTANPYKLELLDTFLTYREVEKSIHEELHNNKRIREWFNDNNEVLTIYNRYKQLYGYSVFKDVPVNEYTRFQDKHVIKRYTTNHCIWGANKSLCINKQFLWILEQVNITNLDDLLTINSIDITTILPDNNKEIQIHLIIPTDGL